MSTGNNNVIKETAKSSTTKKYENIKVSLYVVLNFVSVLAISFLNKAIFLKSQQDMGI